MTNKRGKPLNHSEKSSLLAEKRTHLSEKRTELAHERTMMGYVRTATTLLLFGIAFFGFSKTRFDFFYITGIIAVSAGIIFIGLAMIRSMKHSHEIRKIKNFFERVIEFRFKK